jgi:hypothetical protein
VSEGLEHHRAQAGEQLAVSRGLEGLGRQPRVGGAVEQREGEREVADVRQLRGQQVAGVDEALQRGTAALFAAEQLLLAIEREYGAQLIRRGEGEDTRALHLGGERVAHGGGERCERARCFDVGHRQRRSRARGEREEQQDHVKPPSPA